MAFLLKFADWFMWILENFESMELNNSGFERWKVMGFVLTVLENSIKLKVMSIFIKSLYHILIKGRWGLCAYSLIIDVLYLK